jgi:hypothetical protein
MIANARAAAADFVGKSAVFEVLRLLALGFVLVALAGRVEAVEVQKVVSAHGIEAWLVEEDTVPLIAMSFAFVGGASQDPAQLPGVANMLSGLLDEGAGDLDSQAFQGALDEYSIELSFDADRDTFGGSLKTLVENRDEAGRPLCHDCRSTQSTGRPASAAPFRPARTRRGVTGESPPCRCTRRCSRTTQPRCAAGQKCPPGASPPLRRDIRGGRAQWPAAQNPPPPPQTRASQTTRRHARTRTPAPARGPGSPPSPITSGEAAAQCRCSNGGFLRPRRWHSRTQMC